MNKQEIIAFMNAHPICQFATVEKDQPHVRSLMLYRADDKGLLFHTASFKNVWRQLQDNPKVEICFGELEKGIQVRVMGRAQEVEDQRLKEEIVAARAFLKPLVEQKGLGMLKVFRISQCRASVWTMAANLEPTTYIDL